MNNKRGSIEIFILSITIIFMIIILTITFLLYIQINSCIYNVKTDLFYIAQNAILAVDHDELAYSNYEINDEILKEKVGTLLYLNYPNYNISVNEVKYDYLSNCILIDISLQVKPIALRNLIGDITLKIKDNVKLKLMEVR